MWQAPCKTISLMCEKFDWVRVRVHSFGCFYNLDDEKRHVLASSMTITSHHVIFLLGGLSIVHTELLLIFTLESIHVSNFINALPCFDKILRHDAPCSTITTIVNTPKTFLEIIFRKYQALDLWNISMGFTYSMCRVFWN